MSKVSVEFDGKEYTLRVDGGSFRVSQEEMPLIAGAIYALDKTPLRVNQHGPETPLRITVEYGTLEKPRF